MKTMDYELRYKTSGRVIRTVHGGTMDEAEEQAALYGGHAEIKVLDDPAGFHLAGLRPAGPKTLEQQSREGRSLFFGMALAAVVVLGIVWFVAGTFVGVLAGTACLASAAATIGASVWSDPGR